MSKFKRFAVACGMISILSAQPASAAGFAINLNFTSLFTETQRSVINAAADFWESAITGYKSGVSLSGLSINVESVAVDGAGGGLAAAGFTSSTLRAGTRYATAGILRFDEADVGILETRGKLIDVAIHEIAHALGFGTLWRANGLYDPSTGVVNTSTSGHYTGAAALAAYQSEYDPTATFVPVEKNFGSGTADAHWDETWAGGAGALMTGRLNLSAGAESYVTKTTIASFNDLGYQVALVKATSTTNIAGSADPGGTAGAGGTVVPLPPAGLLLLGSVVMLGAARRRKAA